MTDYPPNTFNGEIRGLVPPLPAPRRTATSGVVPGRQHDGEALCHPRPVRVRCACGRDQLGHEHDLYVQAGQCLDCFPGPTGVAGHQRGCFSAN
jgi:hypothetical protein